MKAPVQIAIDGPVGAGKSDIASRLAENLGFLYIYTGAMYRALAFFCVREHIACDSEPAVLMLLNKTKIALDTPSPNSPHPVTVLVNGQDQTQYLFDPVIDTAVPIVSSLPRVRQVMVERQQQIADGRSVVMEGRDIGIRVLPHAQLKIYLTASIEERSRRRFQQLQKKGIQKSYEEVLLETQKRDIQDMNRASDPLRRLPDAWELDTTGLSQAEVIEKIRQELIRRQLL